LASKRTFFFQTINVIAAIFLARVRRAIEALTGTYTGGTLRLATSAT
jgi:hypothetical protein